MVLNTVPIDSIFTTSNTTGVGFGADRTQQTLDDNDLSGFKAVQNHWNNMSDNPAGYVDISFSDNQETVTFDVILKFTQWSAMGNSGIFGDGSFKVEYLDLRTAEFTEWIPSISMPTLGIDNWTPYAQASGVVTNKIRITKLVDDSFAGWVVRFRAIY
jgi:hypothetical protein